MTDISWDGRTPVVISFLGGVGLKQFRYPCRKDTPLAFDFTFKDQDLNVIDLTPYPIVTLVMSQNGVVVAFLSAALVSAQGGSVRGTYTPAAVGLWDAQFFVSDVNDHTLYGEPVQFTVVPNLPDLSGQQPNY